MIAATLRHLRGLLRPPDPRSPREVEADLEDEIRFHLEALEREELAEGATPEAAQITALRRFGDPARIRAACRRIDLEERIVLQRFNALPTALLLVGVVILGVQVYRAQGRNADVLARLERSVAALAGEERRDGPVGGGPMMAGVVHVHGEFVRPGMDALPARVG